MIRVDQQGRDVTELHGLHDETDITLTKEQIIYHWLQSLGLNPESKYGCLTQPNLEAIAADTEAFLRARMELPEKGRSF